MPAIKVRPSRHAKKRDFWGDADRGQLFVEQIDKKFGEHFGSRKVALAALKLQRRLFNMYITGERSIPDAVWSHLRRIPDYKKPAVVTTKTTPLYVDDVDPLS